MLPRDGDSGAATGDAIADSTTAANVLDVLEGGVQPAGVNVLAGAAGAAATATATAPLHTEADLTRALASAGYGATLLETHRTGGAEGQSSKTDSTRSRVTYQVDGIVCEACPERIRRRMRMIPGVQHTLVDESKSTVTVVWDALRDHIGVRTFMAIFDELGYGCQVDDASDIDRAGAQQRAAEIRSNKVECVCARARVCMCVYVCV